MGGVAIAGVGTTRQTETGRMKDHRAPRSAAGIWFCWRKKESLQRVAFILVIASSISLEKEWLL
jgi:hypothetical protein